MPDFKMPYPVQFFTHFISSDIRKTAQTVPDFNDGAIAIRYISRDTDADLWLGMPSAQIDDPNVDLDFVFPIKPGGRKTRPAGWRGNPDYHELSCAGVAIAMLEGCARAVINDFGRCSDDLPDSWLTFGSDNRKGALCFDIDVPDSLANPQSFHTFLRIYVAVCGATDDEDKRCAYAAFTALEKLLNGSGAAIVSPAYNPNDIAIVD